MGSPGGGGESVGGGSENGGARETAEARSKEADRAEKEASKDDQKSAFDDAKDKAEKEAKNKEDNSSRPDRAPAAPPSTPDTDDDDDTRPTDNTDRPDRAPAAPPSKPETDDEDDRAAGPPGIGAPPSTPEAPDNPEPDNEDDQKPAAGPPGIGAPPSTPTVPESSGPDEPPENEEDSGGLVDQVGDFLGDLAQDTQDFERANPRVDSYGNPVGIVDADGIQRGEVYSRMAANGMTSEGLADLFGFTSSEDMATAQNTDFIEQKFKDDLALRAIEEALDGRYHQHPDLAVIRGVGPVLTDHPILEDLEMIPAMQAAVPAEVVVAMSQAAEMRPDIPSGAWARAAAILSGAMQGFSKSLAPAGVVSQVDTPAIGPADLVALGMMVAGAIAGGADASKAFDAAQSAIEGLVSYNESEGPNSIDGLSDGERTTVPIGDLEPLHDAETSGKRPELEGLSDDELIDSVENPAEGDHVKVNTETGKVVDGNGRLRELQDRAKDPDSSITPDTEITIEGHTPDNSAFDWDF